MNVQTEVELDLGLREWLRVCFLETSVQIMQKEEKIRHYEQTYRVANENLTVWWQIWGRDASGRREPQHRSETVCRTASW